MNGGGARTAAAILAVIVALGACESPPATPLSRVSVLRYDPALKCYANMTGTDAPVDPALKAPNMCPASAPDTVILAGIDRLAVLVDYGPGIEFEPTATVPAPTVVVSVDGQSSSVAIQVSPVQFAPGGRAYFLATFSAPSTPSTNVGVAVSVAPGFSFTVPTRFEIRAAKPTIAVTGCPAPGPCTVTAGVGAAQLTVTAPGAVPQQIAFRSLVDGIEQPDTIPAVLTKAAGDHTEGVANFPVPIAAAGSTWVIEADLGPERSSTAAMTLAAPKITAVLACKEPCTFSQGASTAVTVTAPKAIRATQAAITAGLDGVPQVTGATINLSSVDVTAGTVFGQLPLSAPTKPGLWSIDVSVAGYHAQTILVPVQ